MAVETSATVDTSAPWLIKYNTKTTKEQKRAADCTPYVTSQRRCCWCGVWTSTAGDAKGIYDYQRAAEKSLSYQ